MIDDKEKVTALILVDLQNDFVPGGSLAVAEGDRLAHLANQLMPQFSQVVATQDWHPPDHQSFASQHPNRAIGDEIQLNGLAQRLWPDHCVQQTPGADLVAELNLASIHHVSRKGTDPTIDSYSGFFDNGHRQTTDLDAFLKRNLVTEVFVMGLATDYCVKFTAMDAIQLGYQTNLIFDGCRGVDLQPGDVSRAVEEMRAAGVHILQSDQLIHGSSSSESRKM